MKIFSIGASLAAIVFCSAPEAAGGETIKGEEAPKREVIYDVTGEKSGLVLHVDNIRFEINGIYGKCRIDISLKNLTDRDIVVKTDNVLMDFGVRVYAADGRLLAQTPVPEPYRLPRAGKNIIDVIKANGEARIIHSFQFKEINDHVFREPVIIQVLRYFEDSPWVLVSPPVLIKADGE